MPTMLRMLILWPVFAVAWPPGWTLASKEEGASRDDRVAASYGDKAMELAEGLARAERVWHDDHDNHKAEPSDSHVALSVTCTSPREDSCSILKVGFAPGEATAMASFRPIQLDSDGHEASKEDSGGFASLNIWTSNLSSLANATVQGVTDRAEIDAAIRTLTVAAGFAEGAITASSIPAYFRNDVWVSRRNVSEHVQHYVMGSEAWARRQAEKHADDMDGSWNAVSLVLARLDGMVAGYNYVREALRLPELNYWDFLWLNLRSDLLDLIPEIDEEDQAEAGASGQQRWVRHGRNGGGGMVQISVDAAGDVGSSRSRMASTGGVGQEKHREGRIQRGQEKKKKRRLASHCSALITLTEDFTELFFGHATWDSYSSAAPRIYKHIRLPWRRRDTVCTQTMSYSSSPGVLGSTDSWYSLRDEVGRCAGGGPPAKLLVMETSVPIATPPFVQQQTSNASGSTHHVTEKSLFSWIRVLVANGLATGPVSWSGFFSEGKSGTYSAQWLVLDVNGFSPGWPMLEDSLWVVEEAPGQLVATDQTARLNEQRYFASFNTFIHKATRQLAGEAEMQTAAEDRRAYAFKKLHEMVNSTSAMKRVMGWSAHSSLHGVVTGAVSRRGDLEPNAQLEGGIDAKISSASLFRHGLTTLARAGPSPDDTDPFCWPSDVQVPHIRHPACFRYDWARFMPEDWNDLD